MRSSKSRSRSKTNRPRTLGNIINRVFDSSGPEGKVRGTPQQLIEKYQQLGRDAQLSNDRVAAENFLQHAEHYTRMLSEAQREMAAEQEARQAQQPAQNGNYGNNNSNYNNNNNSNNNNPNAPRNDRPEFRNDRGDGASQPRFEQPRGDQNRQEQPRQEQSRHDQPRGDQNRNEQPRFDSNRPDNRSDNRQDAPRQDRRPDPRDERRDDRRPVTSLMPEFPDIDDESGLVETPEARPAQEHDLPVAPPPSAAAAPDDATAKRARAPRRPKTDADAPMSGEAAADKPVKARGPAKPREAAE